MISMAESATNWRNTHAHVDRTHSLMHLHQHSYSSHVVRSTPSAIAEVEIEFLFWRYLRYMHERTIPFWRGVAAKNTHNDRYTSFLLLYFIIPHCSAYLTNLAASLSDAALGGISPSPLHPTSFNIPFPWIGNLTPSYLIPLRICVHIHFPRGSSDMRADNPQN